MLGPAGLRNDLCGGFRGRDRDSSGDFDLPYDDHVLEGSALQLTGIS